MNRKQKYDAILEMESVDKLTCGEHPSRSAFYRALETGRVAGAYNCAIVITSNDPLKSYTFRSNNISGDWISFDQVLDLVADYE